MTPPDKCPRCGAKVMLTSAGVTFLCDTWAMSDEVVEQSRECTARQRDQLAARVDLLNRGNETARKMICEAIGIENQAGKEDILGAIGALRDRVTAAERERNQALEVLGAYKLDKDELKAQIEALKNPAVVAANVLRGQIAESRGFVGDHRALLEACGTYEIPEAVAVVEGLRSRVKELEEAGDALVADNLDMGNLTRWHRAREGKP